MVLKSREIDLKVKKKYNMRCVSIFLLTLVQTSFKFGFFPMVDQYCSESTASELLHQDLIKDACWNIVSTRQKH